MRSLGFYAKRCAQTTPNHFPLASDLIDNHPTVHQNLELAPAFLIIDVSRDIILAVIIHAFNGTATSEGNVSMRRTSGLTKGLPKRETLSVIMSPLLKRDAEAYATYQSCPNEMLAILESQGLIMIAKLCVVAVAHGANVGTGLTIAALTNASRICSTAMCSKYRRRRKPPVWHESLLFSLGMVWGNFLTNTVTLELLECQHRAVIPNTSFAIVVANGGDEDCYVKFNKL